MERNSFVFYKSFYEAVIGLPNDIKLEVLTAIVEYGLYGIEPDDLKPFAKGMFTLVKPNIDINNTRFLNGKKGGRKSRAKTQTPPPAADSAYLLTYEQEVERMKADAEWRKIVCEDFGIAEKEFDKRLSRFLSHCNEEKKRKKKERHDSYEDAKSHLRYWLTKAFPQQAKKEAKTPEDTSRPLDYSFSGGFGSKDK